jgi:glycerol kinase
MNPPVSTNSIAWFDSRFATRVSHFHICPSIHGGEFLANQRRCCIHRVAVGITQHTTKGHIARATLEATCYQTKAILDAMEKDSGRPLESLAVDGGLSNSDLCMQTQADITGIRVDRPAMRETTALGAAIAAGLATGVWGQLEDLKHVNQVGRRVFSPVMERTKADKLFTKWEQAVEMSRGWLRD